MKKIYFTWLLLLAVQICFTACQGEEPFSTITAYDDPRILDPTFPDKTDGQLPVVVNMNRDTNFTMTLTVTPADYCSVSWLLDGVEVAQGVTIDMNLKAGTYHLRVNVSTEQGKSTFREGLVQVNPLEEDPWAIQIGHERIIAPGCTARLYGHHLEKVTGIVIANQTVTRLVQGGDDQGMYLEYQVPQEVTEGEHRIILLDADGQEFGGDKVNVSRKSLVISGADRMTAGKEWTLSGINLSKIKSLTLGEQTVTEFIEQSDVQLVLTAPQLTDGEYTLSGMTVDGEPVLFYSEKGSQEQCTVIVSSMVVLWKGHHYVSWDLPDDNPNKTFNLIGREVFAEIKAGATLYIHYSIQASDEYHQMRTVSTYWNDLPGTAAFDFNENGVKELVLTQPVLDMILNEGGFLCVGHGYFVDMIAVM